MNLIRRAARFSVAQMILSFSGAVVAGTLWWAHRSNVELPCFVGGGCATVADSAWAHVSIGPWHSIPLGLIGLIGYAALFVLSLFKWAAETERAVRALQVLILLISAGGFSYSWYLQYVSHFMIGAFCVYCFTSACLMTGLFAAAAIETLGGRRRDAPPQPNS